jgi:outer membrane protein OmpA-like peptidoglycan-associated protein
MKTLFSIGDNDENESHWISLSDMMTGLMMIFLLLSMTLMVGAEQTSKIASTYQAQKSKIYQELVREFKDDLNKWDAEIDDNTLTIKFNNDEVLFKAGNPQLNPKFKTILNDFIPRYVAVLAKANHKNNILEVRIEGHTSSEWAYGVSQDNAYFNNMALSQARTRSVLQYILNMPTIRSDKHWLMKYLTANGLSSSRPILNGKGKEDSKRSRRVEFRIVTNAEGQISEILRQVGKKS